MTVIDRVPHTEPRSPGAGARPRWERPALAVLLVLTAGLYLLSLIHISEPTRPY